MASKSPESLHRGQQREGKVDLCQDQFVCRWGIEFGQEKKIDNRHEKQRASSHLDSIELRTDLGMEAFIVYECCYRASSAMPQDSQSLIFHQTEVPDHAAPFAHTGVRAGTYVLFEASWVPIPIVWLAESNL
jgi:hypothetical protein